MAESIKDGTGLGFSARVDSRFNLHTASLGETIEQAKAKEGETYSLSSATFLPVTATGGRALFVNYTEPSKLLVLQKFIICWNGGDTNKNRMMEIEFAVGDTAPDTNTIPYVAINTNAASTNTMNASVLVWNGVGDGMTGHTPGLTVARQIVGPGLTIVPLDSLWIFGPQTTLSVTLRGDELGRATISAQTFLLDPDLDIG